MFRRFNTQNNEKIVEKHKHLTAYTGTFFIDTTLNTIEKCHRQLHGL